MFIYFSAVHMEYQDFLDTLQINAAPITFHQLESKLPNVKIFGIKHNEQPLVVKMPQVTSKLIDNENDAKYLFAFTYRT